MCRMLVALGKIEINSLIDSLIAMAKDETITHEHNEKKKVRKWKHPHGWGIAYLKGQKWIVKKSIKPIFKDKEVDSFRNLKTKVSLMHARKGTRGDVSIDNVHPFQKDTFILCHNGTIRGEIPHSKTYKVKGTTDSEKLFYSILDDFKGNPTIIRKKLKELDIRSGSNVIFSSPTETYIVIYFKKYPKYYSMTLGKGKNSIIISSEKLLNLKNIKWHFLENGDIVTINHKTLKVSIDKEKQTKSI